MEPIGVTRDGGSWRSGQFSARWKVEESERKGRLGRKRMTDDPGRVMCADRGADRQGKKTREESRLDHGEMGLYLCEDPANKPTIQGPWGRSGAYGEASGGSMIAMRTLAREGASGGRPRWVGCVGTPFVYFRHSTEARRAPCLRCALGAALVTRWRETEKCAPWAGAGVAGRDAPGGGDLPRGRRFHVGATARLRTPY